MTLLLVLDHGTLHIVVSDSGMVVEHLGPDIASDEHGRGTGIVPAPRTVHRGPAGPGQRPRSPRLSEVLGMTDPGSPDASTDGALGQSQCPIDQLSGPGAGTRALPANLSVLDHGDPDHDTVLCKRCGLGVAAEV